MNTRADVVIEALRSGHDDLVGVVGSLSADDLRAPSGCSEWDVSQVLSHLGSGAEINLATLDAALAGEDNPGGDFNRGVWARWDVMTPADRLAGFLDVDQRLVEVHESLGEHTRESLRIDLGFLPEAVDVATAAAFRLNEFALHAWDVKVAFEPSPTLAPEAVPLLFDVVDVLLGFIGKAEALGGRHGVLGVETVDPHRSIGLQFGDTLTLVEPPEHPDAVLTTPAEAWLRLVAGRLSPQHTPSSVSLTGGDFDLADLRRVFPGF